jgi:hydrogenase maturation factor
MNLVYGEVLDVAEEDGMRVGRVCVSGAIKKISLDLLEGVQCGDRILICDGLAIGKVAETSNNSEARFQSLGVRFSRPGSVKANQSNFVI